MGAPHRDGTPSVPSASFDDAAIDEVSNMFRWIRWRRRSRRAADVVPDPAPIASKPQSALPRTTGAPPADTPVVPESHRLEPPSSGPGSPHLQPRVPPPTATTGVAIHRPGLTDTPAPSAGTADLELTPDELYVGYLLQYLGKGSLTNTAYGELATISIVGRLRDRSIAWVNAEKQWCGHFPASMLGGILPIEGDTVRARVIAHPWGTTVEAIDPNSHLSQFARRATSPTVERAAPPDSVLGTWRADLVAGDLVLADVPYDGHLPVDPQGRRSKQRPAVFIRWEHDYGLFRAVYGRSGWVDEQGHGLDLTDTPTLDKPSVVRNAEFDLQPDRIIRLLGRLGPKDLLRMGLSVDERRQTQLASRLSPPARQATTGVTIEEAFLSRHPSLTHRTRRDPAAHPSGLLHRLLDAIETDGAFAPQLADHGVTLACVGGIFKLVIDAHGTSIQKGTFKHLVTEAMQVRQRERRSGLAMVHNELGHLVLRTGVASHPVPAPPDPTPSPQPVLRDVHVPRKDTATPTRKFLALDEDYEAPDLIVLDQQATSRMVGDDRLALDDELERLRDGGDAVGVIVGSNREAGWASFQRAAQDRGWTVVVADSREEQLRAAISAVRDHDAALVTVVTTFADIVAEIENHGYEIQIVSRLDYE